MSLAKARDKLVGGADVHAHMRCDLRYPSIESVNQQQ